MIVRFTVVGKELVDKASSRKIPLTQFFSNVLPKLGNAKLVPKDGERHVILLNGSGCFQQNSIQGEKLVLKKNGAAAVLPAVGHEKNSIMLNEILL